MSEKLRELTPEEEALIPIVRDEYINLFDSLVFDEAKARRFAKFVYELSNLTCPEIHICESPYQANELANKLMGNVTKQFYSTSYYTDVRSYGWVAFYDFFHRIGVLQDDKFLEYCDSIKCNIYSMITFDEACIISKPPLYIKKNANMDLHSEEGPAVEFSDGYKLYFWNGLNIPARYIEAKDSITKEDIINEKNAEQRRCIQEILGTTEFAKRLDLIILDEDVDLNNLPVRLYRTKEIDDIAEDYIYFYGCQCISTGREYLLCVPECKNVWEAKGWGFDSKFESKKDDFVIES